MIRLIVPLGCLALLAARPARGFILSSVDPDPWLTTASVPRIGNGDPATITWSIVPDGTNTDTGFGTTPSNLIAFMNSNFGGNPLQPNLTQQPWFHLFGESFDRWTQLGGATFVYEPHDDGVLHPSSNGVLGVRGDIRIAGFDIDDDFGDTLAFTYVPTAGSDMAFDSGDVAFYSNSTTNHINFRNTLMHEIGHAFGLLHVNSSSRLMMEPVIDTTFDGPQLDEVRGVQFFFGDANEKANGGQGNGSAALATQLGLISGGATAMVGADANVAGQALSPSATDFVSVSNAADVDFYSFTVSQPSHINATLTPRGGVFTQASVGQTPTSFDANARSNLALTILDADGLTILASADVNPAGMVESLANLLLPAAGSYYARVAGADDTIQLYELSLSASALLNGDLDADGFVGQEDLNIILGAWGENVTADQWLLGDPSGDGFVGQADLNDVLGNWGQGLPLGFSAVPEPSRLWLAGWAFAFIVYAFRRSLHRKPTARPPR